MEHNLKLKQISIAMMAAAVCLPVVSQTKVGDFIESQSYNEAKRGAGRTLNYYPEGNDFVCVNGDNRYTRALYGGYTDYRIETSDRPIFAIYKKRDYKNLRLRAAYDGRELRLDSVEWCEARYSAGTRRYLLRDSRWGGGATLRVEVVASKDSELAVWQFRAEGFAKPLVLKALLCDIANPKLHRNGDIGADKPGCFEPAPGDAGLVEKEWQAADGSGVARESYFAVEGSAPSDMSHEQLAGHFGQARSHFSELAGRVSFVTPDPYINTLGGALVIAADGDWDGQTWLHGCIGWRMPLAGWRAGYLGDVLGWDDRARSHFDAYAKSQVTDVEPTIPHPSQDPAMNMARAEKRWGTQMYSNGYICRNPEKNNQMHHYDMNLNYIDELLWHFCYNADTAYMRKMWPVIKSHLAWEKRNYDPDGDGLYDAYCCIWASDALYYSGGAVTHSSAYNYRGNLLAARIARIIGEDDTPYQAEADKILAAMNARLWLDETGHWVEFEEAGGLGRKHESAALWSVYTPIDCEAGSPSQCWRATRYVDRSIPHIPVDDSEGRQYGSTISTSNWMPYSWSINNVAAAEVMHTALAYFEAGRADAGFSLLKANIMDQMYLGSSPGNFGQLSFYDAARGECYRDFGDCIGISSRALIQGLFGIVPDALDGLCVIRPGMPSAWDSASVSTPYITYKYRREAAHDVYEITQNFAQPLKIVLRQNLDRGGYRDIEGTSERHQVITVDRYVSKIRYVPEHIVEPALTATELGLDEPTEGKFRKVNIDKQFNSGVADIFRNEYRSPRPQVTTLQIPLQGVGEWCHPALRPEINDSAFRAMARNDEFVVAGVPFRTLSKGNNIAYTSLWDNYPDSVSIPLSGKAGAVYLLMAGSTNHMQSRIDNGIVVATYKDGTADTLRLRNPDNWCPIEQDYFVDGQAFSTTSPRPYRVCLSDGTVSRDLGSALGITGVYGREIPGGAAQMLRMPLDRDKKLKSLTVRTLSNDVVIGLMGLTLQ